MRATPDKEMTERRINDKYKKLRGVVGELVQTLQDAIPPTTALGDVVELEQLDGYIEVTTNLKARAFVMKHEGRKFTFMIEEMKNK